MRAVEVALGDGVKRPTAAELDNAAAARTSIVAARAIAAGETLTADNLTPSARAPACRRCAGTTSSAWPPRAPTRPTTPSRSRCRDEPLP